VECKRFVSFIWRCRQYAVFLLAALLSLPVLATPEEALEHFSTLLERTDASGQLAFMELQQLNVALIQPASMYPAFGRLPLPVLSQIYRFRRQCSGTLEGASAATREFEQALCDRTILPPAWFASHAPIHPLGGSYAWHYLTRHPDASAALQPYLHVRERLDAFAGLGRLSDDNLDAMVGGQRWLLQRNVLWWEHDQVWRRYDAKIWQPLARQADLQLQPAGERCDLALGNICANSISAVDKWWTWILAAAALLIVIAPGNMWWQRRRRRKREQFILQMLTHELRTPIANLGNIVEAFRHDFDALPERAQTGFGRLADGVQRMRQLADASRHYLNADGEHELLEQVTTVQLSEWLHAVAERHQGLQFCLRQDRQLALPLYWIDLCLDNVLNNAYRYGVAPVRLSVRWRRGWLRLTVSDGGALAAYRLAHMRRTDLSGPGMGLGLVIVRRVMKRLKGKIRLSGPPTTFTLELPCE
jgi:signal transduction histidine kinase